LLISIFILLLISVVAIALVVASGTESSLAGNYRSSTGVYYAAVAGLEEVRARLRPQDPNSFKNTDSGFLPAGGAPLASCSPVYVINPVGGETVAPWDPASTYPDTEFNQEFAGICTLPNPSPWTPSIWNRAPLNGLPFPGPLYKWVRINGVSEKSLNLDVGPAYDNFKDLTPVYFDGALNNTNSGKQVLEVTALAVLPNGSQKIVQYLVGQVPITLPPFLAALTLSGSQNGGDPAFHAPASNNVYAVKGDGDQDCNGNPVASKAAIGIYGKYQGVGNLNNALNGVIGGIPGPRQSKYTGSGAAPDVEPLPGPFQTPSQLDAIAQTIVQNADVVINPGASTAHSADLAGPTSGMSPSNPLTIAVTGNLDITNWGVQGHGLLLVTGTFTYDPDTNWDGIILVIGQGAVNGLATTYANIINGAVFVATTRDAGGNLLPDPNLGGASVQFSDPMNGFGIQYSSCWIQKAQPTSNYRILSFHEIAQP